MESFEALSIRGPAEFLHGFVAGWGAGSGLEPLELQRRVLWAHDWQVSVAGHGEGLFGAMRGRRRPDLLVRADAAAALVAALESAADVLHIDSRRPIAGAHFEFDFEIFARDEAAAVRALFEALPAGVTLRDERLEEQSNRDAAGLEMFGAVHDYVCRGGGVAVGEVAAILALHERARQHERVRCREVRLELAP